MDPFSSISVMRSRNRVFFIFHELVPSSGSGMPLDFISRRALAGLQCSLLLYLALVSYSPPRETPQSSSSLLAPATLRSPGSRGGGARSSHHSSLNALASALALFLLAFFSLLFSYFRKLCQAWRASSTMSFTTSRSFSPFGTQIGGGFELRFVRS